MKRRAIGFLVAGLILAVGTPIYASYMAPGLRTYLMHPTILVAQAVPYLVCAALWLPWRSSAAANAAAFFSGILLAVAIVLYVPLLLNPGARGGDMIGLAALLVSIVTTSLLLAGSALAWLVLRQQARSRRDPAPNALP